ncbi:MAG: hypothetical protein WEB00_03720 [Dehalococcoidia bacterium]
MGSDYERLNLAQSLSGGRHGKILRLISRIAMLTIEVPEAMKGGDWPEQRRLRGDLDEALARLVDFASALPAALGPELSALVEAGHGAVRAILITPRGSTGAVALARASSSAAVAAADRIREALDEGSGGEP